MTVSEKLRLVYGLHHHAEMFGFNWDDGSDWTWHDVACKIADEVDAENAKLRSQCADLVDERERLFHANVEKNGEILRLVGENTKLRELCKDMMAFVEDDDACEHCGHDAECVEAADGELVLPYEGRCLMLDLFADRIRELGAEVMHE